MSNKFDSIENKLTVNGGEVVAVVHPDIAKAIHDSRTYKGKIGGTLSYLVGEEWALTSKGIEKTEGPDSRDGSVKVGKTYLGLYGSIGEVDLFKPYAGIVSLVGVVHIPKQILPLIGVFKDEKGVTEFYESFFKQTEGDEWKGNQWNIKVKECEVDVNKVKGLPFISEKGYNWKVEKVRNDIFEDGRPIEDQLVEYELAVKKFIIRLDEYIHNLNPITAGKKITPEAAKVHYNKLQKGEVKMIGM